MERRHIEEEGLETELRGSERAKNIILLIIDFTNLCFPNFNIDNYVLENLTFRQGAISSSNTF